MTWTDPIVEEVRKERQEYAEKFNFDLDAIYNDLKTREATSGRTYVDFTAKSTAPKSAGTSRPPKTQP
jgi:hypothetical protein